MALGSWFPVVLLAVVALLVVAGMLALPYLAAPTRKNPVKEMPYESGMDPVGSARGRFDVRFYLVAILFLLFDVELLFLYPWAVSAWHEHGLSAGPEGAGVSGFVLVEILVFVILLALAYVYAWRKGVFDWN